MAAPVLKELFMDRYGVDARGAQVFMAVNLLGAVAAVPLLAWARRRIGAVPLIVAASIADGMLLLALAAPVGFVPSLVLRAVEGVTDVVVFAALFDLVRAASGGHAARGLGLASTPLLLGLGIGAVLGGQAAQMVGQGSDAAAVAVFGASAGFCSLAAVLAWVGRGRLGHGRAPATEVRSRPTPGAPSPAQAAPDPAVDVRPGRLDDRPRPLWWSCAMAFADRATGGLITGTLPLVLADALGYSRRERGWLIGVPLLLMALCTGPAGLLCDRVGSLRMRLAGGVVYALSIAAIPLAGERQPLLLLVMVGVGVSGSVLFSSSLALAAESTRGAVGLGAFRAAGDTGFFAGTTLSIAVLAMMGSDAPSYADYAWVIIGFAAGHLVVTAALAALAARGAPRLS
jgi:MFS family permease